MKDEQLQFEFEMSPTFSPEYYREGAQDLIRRILPEHVNRSHFDDMLPLLSWSDLSKAPCNLSVLLLSKYRFNGCNFFYDMVSRWLLPQKQVKVELFFASDVRLPHLSEDLLSVAEIVIYLKSAQEVEEVRRNLKAIETEIRLGIVSEYQARRILEFKGLDCDGKTAMIQEKIGSLISRDFDKGIFAQMQQFLVNCPEEFKNQRDYHHMSRIISNLYSLREQLKQNISVFPTKRYVHLKYLKTQLTRQIVLHDGSEETQSRNVLGVLVGINFLAENEVFETTHFVNAIQKHFPEIHPVEGSFFIDRHQSLQTLYLEVEKEGDFTIQEIQLLRTSLPDQIKEHIEKLAHPIFMPRNEEDVLRNIMTLSGQLRYVNDMPQVIISFDEQKGDDLSFTVILLRVQPKEAPSMQTIFAECPTPLRVIPDRVRRVGHIRKKYVKEATVFRALVNSSSFLRSDCSIDLYKARSYVFQELSKLVGEIRDYNGGMIYRQNECLEALKQDLGKVGEQHYLLLEKFYYSLEPLEMRTATDTESLKQLFLLFLQYSKTAQDGDFLYKQDEKRALVIQLVTESQKRILLERIAMLSLPAHQVISFSLETEGALYLGHLLFSEDRELQLQFLSEFND
ncbi:MAG TPA: hypothetical protein VLE96_01255 [Chlamydiales bacterium]|nr:hypothetical protein [Chlamydiales bacterium]